MVVTMGMVVVKAMVVIMIVPVTAGGLERVVPGGQRPGTRPGERILGIKEAGLHLYCTLYVEATNIEQFGDRRVCHRRVVELRHGVHTAEPLFEGVFIVFRDEIDLVDDQLVRESDLGEHLVSLAIEVRADVFAIDERDDAVKLVVFLDVFLHEKGLSDGCRIGHTGGLKHDPVDLSLPVYQLGKNSDEVAANVAADAAIIHLEDFFVGVDNKILVNTDFTEFVFDDGDAQPMVLGQYAIQQRRLTAAKKAGENGDGNLGAHVGASFRGLSRADMGRKTGISRFQRRRSGRRRRCAL